MVSWGDEGYYTGGDTRSGGTCVDRAVEIANDSGVMLGIVARKPLLRLKGNGQKRIAVR